MLHGHGFDMLKVTLRVCTKSHIFEYSICNRAARYIACNWHAHLVSKAGSVIIYKSPSPVFKMERHFKFTSRSSPTSYAIRAQNRR